MPKLLPEIENSIRCEARRQIFAEGYDTVTMRSVAGGCDIAAGTIYHYYPSKDALVAAVILEDWNPVFAEMKKECESGAPLFSCCSYIYGQLLNFEKQYAPVFGQAGAVRAASSSFAAQHERLRGQIASLLEIPCRAASEADPFLPEFLAEALLAWAGTQKPFEALSGILKKIVHI